jgi:hypothetical protein
MSALETCKENFAPLKGGRSANKMLEAVTLQSKPNELELKLRAERQCVHGVFVCMYCVYVCMCMCVCVCVCLCVCVFSV